MAILVTGGSGFIGSHTVVELQDAGYEVDVIEFVDFEHSPKNLMLRARRTGSRRSGERRKAEALKERYGFRQSLLELTEKHDAPLPEQSVEQEQT